jgi:hypothetical protein
MALGALWYSPVLFGPRWQALTGRSDAEIKATMPKALVVDLVGSLVMAIVLVHAVRFAGVSGIPGGAAIGAANWLGFIALTGLSVTLYENRKPALWLINSIFLLVALVIMGALLAVWH